MTKEQAINKIKNTPQIYLNDDQKRIAIGIIKSIPEGQDILNYFDFIMKRSNVGFKFDVAPEIAIGRIAVVNEISKFNINITDKVDVNENKLIIGDNYEALKNLLLTHKKKIDFIYIDPPYNTEKSKEDGNISSKNGESLKFIYKDKFGRNGWLNMMRDRLLLAKKLLSFEGSIFVSIDDSEQAYLKVLMDDIFGENNFVASMPRILKKGGKSGLGISKTHDYIIVYTKNSKKEFLGFDVSEKTYSFSDRHEKTRGKYHLKQTLDYSSLQYSKNMDFKIVFEKNEFYPGGEKSFNERKSGNFKNIDWVWRWSKEKVEAAKNMDFLVHKNGRIYTKTYFNVSLEKENGKYKIKSKKRTKNIETTHFVLNNKYNNDNSKKELGKIIEKGLFNYPKSIDLIIDLIKLIDKKDFFILDFFAGSGTTGQAVMQLNREDKGNRKFILVTNNENNLAIDITYERLYRIIKGESTNKYKNFDWIKNNDPYLNTKLRVFNIKHFDVETNQSKKLDKITNFAIENLYKINPNYNPTKLQAYYDLDGLNPLNESQKKQIYSTDKILHEEFNSLINSKKYCTCGKSFKVKKELKNHINKENIK